MKTAMKRLLSLVLVAMMLVSVVPFQASATQTGYTITFKYADGTPDATGTTNPDGTATLSGSFYELGSDVNLGGTPHTFTKNTTVYAAGCQVTFSVECASPSVSERMTFTVPFTEGQVINAVKAALPTWVPNYDRYGAPTVNVSMDSQSVTVNLTPVEAEPWTIYVLKDNKVASETKKDYFTAPTQTDSVLAAALQAVLATIDDDKYQIEVSTWDIDDSKNTATVNVTTSDKPEVKPEYKVTFILCDKYDDSCAEVGKCQTVVIETVNQKLTHTPDLPERYRYQFSGWKNKNTGNMGLQETYTGDVTYEAIYTKKADTNLHKVNVYGVIYSHGKTHTLGSPLVTIYATDGANLLTALKEKTTSIQNELNARGYTVGNKYEWDGNTFYTNYYFTTENEVTSGAKITGDGTYYVKVNYTGTNKVQIYVHTAKTLTIKDTVTLTTYVPGETISKSDVITAVENAGWRYSNFRTYTRDSWEKIVDRDSTSAANETKAFEVVDGETEIHVYLTNSSAAITGDNPKTGDAILMAVTVLGLSAAALAAVYFFSKKKQSM